LLFQSHCLRIRTQHVYGQALNASSGCGTRRNGQNANLCCGTYDAIFVLRIIVTRSTVNKAHHILPMTSRFSKRGSGGDGKDVGIPNTIENDLRRPMFLNEGCRERKRNPGTTGCAGSVRIRNAANGGNGNVKKSVNYHR
jgi:hypothetical protein